MAGGINVVDVEDAAEAFVNALERGDNGQTYILGNTNIPLKELFRQLALIRKKPRRLIKVPFPCAYAAAWGIEGISNCLRIPAFVTRHKVVSLYNNYSYCSAQKAVGTLALPQTPLEMTLEKAAAWFLRDS
jgi:nucleoside-diphosphate-sugar epimerase